MIVKVRYENDVYLILKWIIEYWKECFWDLEGNEDILGEDLNVEVCRDGWVCRDNFGRFILFLMIGFSAFFWFM